MSVFPRKIPWTRKPSTSVRVNPAHPANKNAVFTQLCNDGLGLNQHTGDEPTDFNASVIVDGGERVWGFDTSSGVFYPANEKYNVNGNLSCLLKIKTTSGAANAIVCTLEGGTGETEAENALLYMSIDASTGGGRYIHEYSAGVNQSYTLAPFFSGTEEFILGIVRDDAAKTVKFYKNGVLFDNYNYTTSATNSGGTAKITLGARLAGGNPFGGSISFAHIVADVWSASLVKSLSDNFYQIFQPRTTYIPYSEAATADIIFPVRHKWFRKPNKFVTADSGNNITKGLVGLFDLYSSTAIKSAAIKGSQVTPTWTNTAPSVNVGKGGLGIGLTVDTAATNPLVSLLHDDEVSTDSITILYIRRPRDTTNRASSAFGIIHSSAVESVGSHCPYSDGTVYWDFGGNGGSNRLTWSG